MARLNRMVEQDPHRHAVVNGRGRDRTSDPWRVKRVFGDPTSGSDVGVQTHLAQGVRQPLSFEHVAARASRAENPGVSGNLAAVCGVLTDWEASSRWPLPVAPGEVDGGGAAGEDESRDDGDERGGEGEVGGLG